MQHYRLRITANDHVTIHDLVELAVASSDSGSGACPADLRFNFNAGCVATMVPRVRLAGLGQRWGRGCGCGSGRGDMDGWNKENGYKEDTNEESNCKHNHHNTTNTNTNHESTRGSKPSTIHPSPSSHAATLLHLGLLVLLFLLVISSTTQGMRSVVLGRASEARDMQMRGFVGGGAVVGDLAGKRLGAWRGGRVEWKGNSERRG